MSAALVLRGVPHATAEYFKKRWDNREKTIEKGKKQNARVEQTMLRSASSAITVASLGYMAGRYDYTEVAGMPLDALTGIACHVAAFFSPELEAPLSSAGDGALAVYLYREAQELGRKQKDEAG